MNQKGLVKTLSLCVVVMLSISLISTSPINDVHASTLARVNLTTDIDDGACTSDHCSLREAVKYSANGDVILFAPALSGGTVSIGSPLVINKNLTINNDNTGRITIDGNSITRVFQVDSGVSLTLSNVNIGNGKPTSSGHGGAILNNGGTVTINDVYFFNNTATIGGQLKISLVPSLFGGGILLEIHH